MIQESVIKIQICQSFYRKNLTFGMDMFSIRISKTRENKVKKTWFEESVYTDASL